MYSAHRVGNRFFIFLNDKVLPGWSTYKPHEAAAKARELNNARSVYFEEE